jgi:Flp pilus assembly protein TadG
MPTRNHFRLWRARRVARDERGTAITEFALVLPLLLVLLLGMIDFGKALNYWIDQTHLANEGARWAIVNNNPGLSAGKTLQQYILDHADTAELHGDVAGTQGTSHAATVAICFYKGSDGTSTTTPSVGDTVQVIVKYDYHWLRYLTAQAGLGPTSMITGKSAMRLEQVPTKYATTDNTGSCPSSA